MKKIILMKKLLFICIFVISLSTISAQEKIYFDSAWSVTTKDKMVYYRELKEEGTLMRIKDFYKSGKLQMEGLALDANPEEEIFEGKVTWYHENGKISQIANFKTGRRVGEFKAYQPDGRLYAEFVYDENGDYSGTSHYYKGDDGRDTSVLETIKNTLTQKRITYDEDIKGIREEENFSNSGNKIEHKYYGENGKLLGTAYDDGVEIIGTYVMYYYNPMRVRNIQTIKKGGKVISDIWYFQNGKINTELKADEKGNGTKKFYDISGKLLGQITTKYSPEKEYAAAYEGTLINFNYDDDSIESIVEYKNYNIIKTSAYEKGKLKKVIISSDNEYNDTEKVTYYNDNGSVKSLVTYQDGYPYNGTTYELDGEINYQNGVEISKKTYYESGKLHSHKQFNEEKKGYQNTVYEENGQIKYAYEVPTESEYEEFTGDINIYKNGKLDRKISIINGILQSGKIFYKDSSKALNEMERNGDWLFVRSFRNNEIVKESKMKVTNDEYDYDLPRFFEEYLLND